MIRQYIIFDNHVAYTVSYLNLLHSVALISCFLSLGLDINSRNN